MDGMDDADAGADDGDDDEMPALEDKAEKNKSEEKKA